MDGFYCPDELNSKPGMFWSSTAAGDNSALAWNVCFENAAIPAKDKLLQVRVRCVRALVE